MLAGLRRAVVTGIPGGIKVRNRADWHLASLPQAIRMNLGMIIAAVRETS
jgi:hypothetical protein